MRIPLGLTMNVPHQRAWDQGGRHGDLAAFTPLCTAPVQIEPGGCTSAATGCSFTLQRPERMAPQHPDLIVCCLSVTGGHDPAERQGQN
jgi:hypothetical protein